MFVADSPPIGRSRSRRGGEAERLEPTVLNKGDEKLILPPADTKRWSSRRKAAVVVAARAGIITREEACQRYLISDEELAAWEAAFDKNGIPGLRISARYSHRPVPLIKS